MTDNEKSWWADWNNLAALLVRGSATSLLMRIFGQVAMFAVMVLLARLMGASEYGIYLFALAWLNIAALIGRMGLDSLLMRKISGAEATEDWARLAGVTRFGLSGSALGGIAAGAFVAALSVFFRDSLEPGLPITLMIAGGGVAFASLSGAITAALAALREIRLSLMPEMIVRPVGMLVMVAVVAPLAGWEYNAPVIMGLYVLVMAMAAVSGHYWLRLCIPAPARATAPTYESASWIRTAFPLMLVSGTFLVFNQTGTIMLGILTETKDAGIFGTASRIAQLTGFVQIAIVSTAAPLISGIYSRNDQQGLQNLLSSVVAMGLAVNVPIILLLMLAARPILSIFGVEFLEGLPALLVLLFSQLFVSIFSISGFLLTMTGNQNAAAIILAIAVILNVLLNVFLVPEYGLMGSAWAAMISTVFWAFGLGLSVRQKLGIYFRVGNLSEMLQLLRSRAG